LKAVILAGGLGTRLREETEFRPKPMVEIGGRPILWHIMKHLSTYGIREFVIAVGYKGEMIKDYFLNYETRNNDFTVQLGQREAISIHGGHDESDWEVTVADTGQETLTGGRIRRVAKYLSDEPFLVAYGDGLSNVDISALVSTHASHHSLATVTITQPPSRYGVVHLNGDLVEGFQEKPRLDGWVNIGYFIFEPRALEYVVNDGSLELTPLVSLARDGELGAYRHNGFWQPMDTFREATLLNDLWNSGAAPWRSWT
jgi:glucose-1-phosphate cytidylyltransferase